MARSDMSDLEREFIKQVLSNKSCGVNATQNPTSRDCHIAEIESHWLQPAQPGRNPHGPLESRHWTQAKGAHHRKSENRSQD